MLNGLGLCLFQATATHGDALAALGAGIGLGALATGRQTAAMAEASVGADVLQSLDVPGDLALEVSFHLKLGNRVSDFLLLFGGQFFSFGVQIDFTVLEDGAAQLPTNAVHVSEADFDSFSFGESDSSDACHLGIKLVYMYFSSYNLDYAP